MYLVFDDSGSLEKHVLFDIGSGVTDSLLENTALALQPRLDWIVLSHWHSDHTQELVRLTTGWVRSQTRLGLEPEPVPVWCRSGSATWIKHLYLIYEPVNSSCELQTKLKVLECCSSQCHSILKACALRP